MKRTSLEKFFPIMTKKDWLEYLQNKKTKIEEIRELVNKEDAL